MDRYKALLAKGEVDVFRQELTRELAKRPDWHEARALLVDVELRAGNYPEALYNMVLLAEADWDVSKLERTLLVSISREKATDLVKILEGSFNPWSRAMALRLALKSEEQQLIVAEYSKLLAVKPDHHLLADTRQEAEGNLPLLWLLTKANSGDLNLVLERLYALEAANLQRVLDDLELEQDPELSVLRTTLESDPLAALLDLEQAGYTPRLPDLYAKLKLGLIFQHYPNLDSRWLKFIDIRHFRFFEGHDLFLLNIALELPESPEVLAIRQSLYSNLFEGEHLIGAQYIPEKILKMVPPERLWQTALSWLDWSSGDEEAQKVLSYLAGVKGWARYAGYFQAVLNPPASPKPERSIAASYFPNMAGGSWSLCPNGRYLVYGAIDDEYGADITLVNLSNFQKVILGRSHLELIHSLSWSPGSKYLARPAEGGKIGILELSGLTQVVILDASVSAIIGWDSDTFLYYYQQQGEKRQVYRYSVTAKTTETIGEPRTGNPALAPDNTLVWTEIDGNKVTLTIAGVDATIILSGNPHERITIDSWLPNGESLVLKTGWERQFNNQYYIVHLPSGRATLLDIPRFHPRVWLDNSRVYGYFTVRMPDEYTDNRLVLVDISKLTLSATGLPANINGNHYSVFTEDQLRIWKIK